MFALSERFPSLGLVRLLRLGWQRISCGLVLRQTNRQACARWLFPRMVESIYLPRSMALSDGTVRSGDRTMQSILRGLWILGGVGVVASVISGCGSDCNKTGTCGPYIPAEGGGSGTSG